MKAVIERRFTLGRLAENAWGALRRPRSACFLVVFVLGCFTAGPLMRYCKDHQYFAVRAVEVQGTHRLAATRVRSWLGMVEGRSIWRASLRELEDNLRRRPAVADAHVRRILPNRLEVTIEEREPDAVVRDSRGLFLADVDGVLFERTRADAREIPEIPIVTVARAAASEPPDLPGPPAPDADPLLGDATSLPSRVLAETISVAARLEAGQGGIEVSEVTIEPAATGDGEPELVVFSTDGRLAVRLGWGSWNQKLRSLARVVAHAERSGQVSAAGLSGHLDVRDPEAVVARWATRGAA